MQSLGYVIDENRYLFLFEQGLITIEFETHLHVHDDIVGDLGQFVLELLCRELGLERLLLPLETGKGAPGPDVHDCVSC